MNMFPDDTLILVVDDTTTMRRIVKNHVKTIGFKNVLEAPNGQVAYETVSKQHAMNQPVGLVLSDWNMPEMKGIALLRQLRADPRFKSLPFIMITAEIKQAQIEEAKDADVSEYLLKPFSVENLREKIQLVWKRHST